MRRFLATAALGTAIATVLVLIRAHPVAIGHRLFATAAWQRTDPDAVLADASATLLWLTAGWLAVGIIATLLASIPGAAGRLFGTVSRLLLPAALRRVVAGSVGLGVLLAPIPAAVAGPNPAPRGSGAADLARGSAAAGLPAPVWPGAAGTQQRDNPPPRQHAVRVRAGDSLWLIAARRLGRDAEPADVAASWPRWYAVNRAVIGDDPDLIHPGQLLRPPAGPRANGPRQ